MVEHKEDTFFKGIKRVPPSTNLVFDLETGHIEKVRYWDIIFINKETRSSSKEDEDYAKKFYSLFESSVRMQLMSEVPVGTCLSGGLDSSSIVLLISRVILDSIGNSELPNTIGERLKTFSAVYDDEKVDEREYIEEVVRNTGVEKNYVFPSGGQLFNELEKLTYYQDEPFFSTSPYAQWNVMKLASRKVKVLLDGQGADELLAGYIPYFRVYLNQLYKEKKILTYIKELLLSLDLTIRHLLPSSMISTIIRYIWYRKIKRKASLSLIREFLNEDFLKENEKGSIKGSNLINNLADLSYMYLMNGSLQNLLRYEDRNSMAFSIEARVPFLDHRIVEYVFSLPLTQRIKNGWTKYILRNAMKGLLPEKVRKRRGKIGFATPEEKWLKENREEIIKIFNSPAFKERKYFNKDVIIKKFEEFCMGKKYDTTLFWRIISLEIWFRVFIDKASNKRNQKVN
jgi:asparagine synthase (glutamine-hydrolysing)